MGKGPENLFSVERVAQEWATLDKQAKQGEQRLNVRSELRSFERLTRESEECNIVIELGMFGRKAAIQVRVEKI